MVLYVSKKGSQTFSAAFPLAAPRQTPATTGSSAIMRMPGRLRQ